MFRSIRQGGVSVFGSRMTGGRETDDEFLHSALVLNDFEGGEIHEHHDAEHGKEKGGHGHGHGHGHGDGHGHGHIDEDEKKKYSDAMFKLKKVLAVGAFFLTAQSLGAWWAGSIAIAADCAHLASDLVGFLMSMIALYLTQKKTSKEYTYGW